MATNRRQLLAMLGLGVPALGGLGKQVYGAEMGRQPQAPIEPPTPSGESLAPSGPRHISVLVGGKIMPQGVSLGGALKGCDDSLCVYSTAGCGEFLWSGCFEPKVAVLSMTIDDDSKNDFHGRRSAPWRHASRVAYQRYPRTPLAMATLRAFYDSYPRLPVIVVLDSSNRESVLQAFRCGARGVVSKGDSLENLCKGIHAVHKRLLWVGPEAGSAVEGLLSPRERDILRSVARGMTRKEMCEYLGLNRQAIEMYMLRIFDKLGVLNRLSTTYWV